jgi:DNA replication licensing factor MCM5
MDRRSVFSSRLYDPTYPGAEDSSTAVRALLEQFILEFRLDNSFIYRFVSRAT